MHVLWAQNIISKSEGEISMDWKRGNPRGEDTIVTELHSVEGKEVKIYRLFCRIYSVNTEWEIITKTSFYTVALWWVFIWEPTLRVLRFLAVGFASSSWPGICAARRENPNGGTSPRLDDKDHERGTGAPYSPAIKKIAGGIYPDLAQGNTISEPKCTVTDPPPSLLSLPSGLFFLGKEQNNFVGFSHTKNRPPP